MKVTRLLLHMKHFEVSYYRRVWIEVGPARSYSYLQWLLDTRYKHLKDRRRLLLLCV